MNKTEPTKNPEWHIQQSKCNKYFNFSFRKPNSKYPKIFHKTYNNQTKIMKIAES